MNIFEREEVGESLDKAIEVAEEIYERAKQRFGRVEAQYSEARFNPRHQHWI